MGLAAKHPDPFAHTAVLVAGWSFATKRGWRPWGPRLLAAERGTEAAEVMLAVAFTNVSAGLARRLLALVVGRVNSPAAADPADAWSGAEALRRT